MTRCSCREAHAQSGQNVTNLISLSSCFEHGPMFVLVTCVYILRTTCVLVFWQIGHSNRTISHRFLSTCSSKSGRAMDDSKTICEGQARMTFGDNSKVFYNPVQEFNRDIRCVCILFKPNYFVYTCE